jgi:hypothetical protein
MARKTYDDVKTLCIVCGDEVPKERIMRGGITCSKEHAKLRRAQLQAITDKKECRYCRRPSTPEEREAYKLFRTLERKQPHLIYPEAFEDWKASGGTPTPEAFAEFRKK